MTPAAPAAHLIATRRVAPGARGTRAVVPRSGAQVFDCLARGSVYRLAARFRTREGARRLRVARKLHAGQAMVNNHEAGEGVELPFGGAKHSGCGREQGLAALPGCAAPKAIALRHD